MFFQVSNVQSSNIDELHINPATRECIVMFKNGSHYSYTDVNAVAIDDLLYARQDDISLGTWVNENLVTNTDVKYDNLDAVIQTINRPELAAA